jgi:hypothetical protein
MSTTRPPRRPDPERQAGEVASSLVVSLGRKDRREYLWSTERRRVAYISYPLRPEDSPTVGPPHLRQFLFSGGTIGIITVGVTCRARAGRLK